MYFNLFFLKFLLDKPSKTYQPDKDFVEQLNPKERKNLEKFQEEQKILLRIYKYLPAEITTNQWSELLLLPTTKERFDYIRFLAKKEVRREADLRQKQLRIEKATQKNNNEVPQQKLLLHHPAIYGSIL